MLSNQETKAALYQGLVDDSSTAVVSVAKENRQILFANNSWKLQEGIPVETEVAGMQLDQLIAPEALFFTPEEIENLPYDSYQESHKKSSMGNAINVHARSITWDGQDAYVCYSNDESELWNNRIRLNGALKSAKVMTWEYDFRGYRISNSGNFGEVHHLPKVIENVPDSLIEAGFIHPESVDEFRKLLKEAALGRSVTRNIRAMAWNKKEYTWNEVSYTPIFDPSGNCVAAVGTSVDITERKERENKYLRQLKSMSQVDEENLLAKGQHNLTRNSTVFYQAKMEGALDIEENGTYDETIAILVQAATMEKEKKEIAQKMNREKLLEDFQADQVEGGVEYYRVLEDGKRRWVLTKYSLFEEPSTGDVMVFIYSYDVTERVIDRQIVAKLSNMDYDAMGLLDVETHQYMLRSVFTKLEGPAVIGSGDFDERVIDRLPATLVGEDKEKVIQQFQVSNIVAQLEEKSSFSITYAVRGNQKNI